MSRFLAILLVAACGTTHVRLDPVKVEPIHLTIDVNMHDAPPAKPDHGTK